MTDTTTPKAVERYQPYGGVGKLPVDCCDFAVVDETTRKEICRCWTLEGAQRIAFVLNRATERDETLHGLSVEITALRDQAVSVVPLEWQYTANSDFIKKAITPLGVYFITDDTDDFSGLFCDFVSLKNATWFGTGTAESHEIIGGVHEDETTSLEAAAQADYERRTLSAITTQSAATGKGKKTVREEAAYIAGREDAQLLCNLYFAGTNVTSPLLAGSDITAAQVRNDALDEASACASEYGLERDAQDGSVISQRIFSGASVGRAILALKNPDPAKETE